MPTPEQDAFLQTVLGINPSTFARGAAGTQGNVASGPQANAGAPLPAGTGGGTQKDPNDPDLTPDQETKEVAINLPVFRETYDAALQGASGKSDPQKATDAAQAIAQEAVETRDRRAAEAAALPVDLDLKVDLYKKFFLESIQGLASGDDSPSSVVSKAHAMALRTLSAQIKDVERVKWLTATLPQRMAPDCEIVRGKVPGPKNHVLCKTHGHVMDTDERMVIAHSIEEYKALHKK